MGHILNSTSGPEFRRLLTGGYSDRVVACLAGNFTQRGHRVGTDRALLVATRHTERIAEGQIDGTDPSATAHVIAQLERFDHDGALERELLEEQVSGEELQGEEQAREEAREPPPPAPTTSSGSGAHPGGEEARDEPALGERGDDYLGG